MANNMSAGRSTKNDFGSKGWLMIVISGLCYFFFAGMINDGLNVIVANFSAEHGVDYNACLASATPAAWFGVIGVAFWTVVVQKIGSRKVGAISLLLGAVSYALYGVVSTVTGFFVVTALVNFMAYGFCNTAAQVMIAHWFPTRKGLALGWATMGTNLSSAVFIPILAVFVALRGVNGSFLMVGAIMIVILGVMDDIMTLKALPKFLVLVGMGGVNGSFFGVGVLVLITAVIYGLLVRDTPEEYGCTPDNGALTEEEIQANLKEIAEYKSPWTVGKLLTNKQVWLTNIAFGVYILVTVSLVSQLIPRLTAGGWAQEKATGMMTVAAVLGLLGSYITGWMDQKIGTKRTSVIYGIWYLAAVLSCCLPASDFAMYLSVFLIGIGIGGIGNLFPSMVGNLFNRHDFARALGVMNVVTLILRSFAFSILAFGLENLGGYSGAYAIVAVINVVGIICCCLIKDEPLKA